MKSFRSYVTMFLSVMVFFIGAAPTFAAEAPQVGTPEYYAFISKTVNSQMEYVAGGRDNPEYRNFIERWTEATQPNMEKLEWYTYLPPRNEDMVWESFFSGDRAWNVLRDEFYRLANELDITNPNLSAAEKVARIDAWAAGEGYRGKVIGSIDEVSAAERAWVVESGSKIYLAGPFVNYDRSIDGNTYNCSSRAAGLICLYRLAGVPAAHMSLSAPSTAHAEAIYYLNNQWWVTAGRNYTDGSPMQLADYAATSDINAGGLRLDDRIFHQAQIGVAERLFSIDQTTGRQSNYNMIKDVDEPWISPNGEEDFMFKLLRSPYVHPEKPLTRGEVAKLLCDYVRVVPMRSSQAFSDVPESHPYAPYIWAANRLGLMTGSDGSFNPDGGLPMQEFAVIANRLTGYTKQLIEGIIRAGTVKSPRAAQILPKLSAQGSNPKVFADANNIAAWAKPSIDEFSKFGILVGDNNGYLHPAEPLSRLRFLVFMAKLDSTFEVVGGSGVFAEIFLTHSVPLF
jgi:hypothetical protein